MSDIIAPVSGKSCAPTSHMTRAFPRKTNLSCVVAKMVKVTLKKGSGALVPPSCSLHRSDAQWCPAGLSRSIRTTTAAGHFGRRRRTGHSESFKRCCCILLLHWGRQVNLQLKIIQHTKRIAGALQGLLALKVLRLTPSVSSLAGSPPARGPFALTGGRM